MPLMDILNINSSSTWGAIICSIFIVEAIMLTTFRMYSNFWGDLINVWYDTFGLVAIILDILIVLIGFWISLWLYPRIFDVKEFKIWKLILLFLAIQITHDLLFYFLIVKKYKGTNSIINLIQKYSNKSGFGTVLGDSLMVVSAILITYGLLWADVSFSTYIILFMCSLYAIGYLLYTGWK